MNPSERKIAIMQPYFMPYIGYFQLIGAVDKFIIYDDVNYINRGWINRNRILLNNKEYILTIPLVKASQNKIIHEINIINENKWKKKLLKTLETAYKKAPFFINVFPIVQTIIMYSEINLSKYISNSISTLCNHIGITTSIERTSTIYNNYEYKGQERILDICEKEKAKEYYNLSGGIELYDKIKFNKKNIKLNFIKTKGITYEQFDCDFIPWLSILDVLMFNPKEKIIQFLNNFELI